MLFFVNKYHVQHTNIDNKKKRSRQMDMRPEIYVGERVVRNNHKIEREKMMLSLRKKSSHYHNDHYIYFRYCPLSRFLFSYLFYASKNIYSGMIMRQKKSLTTHIKKKWIFCLQTAVVLTNTIIPHHFTHT